jgi:poly(A) polymerase
MKKQEIAKKIVEKLNQAGHTAFFAGGAVRDILMNKKPGDFDIATSAKPEEIEKIFKNTKPVGKQFGVILVIIKSIVFEVATFRSDFGYSDNRRPDKVKWVSAKEDAKRRDFTINGIFYDPIAKKYYDYVDGKKDIKAKILRFIGNPDNRIQEDSLRIIRAVRFKNRLGFEYETKTKQALLKNAAKIKNVSQERIQEELNKILLDENRTEAIKDLEKFGMFEYILPELLKMRGVQQPKNWHQEGDVWTHTLLCIESLPKKTKLSVAWAVLLHDVGKPATYEIKHRICFYGHCKKSADIADIILKRLKFPNDLREKIVFLIGQHLRHKDIKRMKEHRARRWANHEWFKDLLSVWLADAKGSLPNNFELYDYAKKIYDEEMAKPKKPKKVLTGNDVMEILNIKPGPEVGKILSLIEDLQWEGKIKTKEEAIKFVKEQK